jgi:hypothetical protein
MEMLLLAKIFKDPKMTITAGWKPAKAALKTKK